MLLLEGVRGTYTQHKSSLESSVSSRHVLVQQPGCRILDTNIDEFLLALKISPKAQQLAVNLFRKHLLDTLSAFYPCYVLLALHAFLTCDTH